MADVRTFLESYRRTWLAVIRGEASLDDLSGFFRVPCFMVGLDGVATLYSTPEDIRAFNATRLDLFQEGRASDARFRGIDLVSQGAFVTLAVVNWELLRADGSVERAWRHYYTLLESGDRIEILVSAFQTGA